MPTATCHCGAVRVTVPRSPPAVNNCGCSICRRYGALWAYYKASTVRIEAGPKATRAYAWGRKTIRFVRCATCGCVMCWEWISPRQERTMGVNARNFDPEILRGVRRRHADRIVG
jgi:hypothetical protein